MHRSAVGIAAEKLAADYLQARSYRILDRNWSRKWGELDLVAHKDDVVIFCEVKASSRLQSGLEPQIRADRTKMIKVVRTARTWLAYRKYPSEQEWQVDVISIVFDSADRSATIKHFKNVEI